MPEQTLKRQRTCISCGSHADKVDLQRIVRPKDGAVHFDASGRAAGRGAYVCSTTCFTAAQKTRKLERALRCKLTEEDYQRVASELASKHAEAAGKNEV